MFNYRKETMTVRDFILRYSTIDTQPVSQRLDRDPILIGRSKPSKAQGIIGSMLKGVDIGQITIHELPMGYRYQFESIDGGHRKRYIKAFHENQFPDFATGKYYREMTKEEREAFLDIELTFCIYENLTGEQVGYIFRALNQTTQVNHQEMLNSYGDIPVANYIRECVRHIPHIDSKFHSLFDYSQKAGETKKKFLNINFDNKGLRIDEMVARLFYRYYDGGGLGTSTDKDLESMYASDATEDQMSKINDKVWNCLDFILKMAEVRKRRFNYQGMGSKEFTLFYRLWLYMESEYGSFKIKDAEEFFDAFSKAYAPYRRSYDQQPKELQEISPFDRTKTVGKQFNDSLAEFDSFDHVFYPVQMLLKDFDLLQVIIVKDKKRSYTLAERESKLAEQGFKCAVDGEPLTLADAEAGHIIAHDKGIYDGGNSSYPNMAMIRKIYNKEMGTMSIDQYKELKGFV